MHGSVHKRGEEPKQKLVPLNALSAVTHSTQTAETAAELLLSGMEGKGDGAGPTLEQLKEAIDFEQQSLTYHQQRLIEHQNNIELLHSRMQRRLQFEVQKLHEVQEKYTNLVASTNVSLGTPNPNLMNAELQARASTIQGASSPSMASPAVFATPLSANMTEQSRHMGMVASPAAYKQELAKEVMGSDAEHFRQQEEDLHSLRYKLEELQNMHHAHHLTSTPSTAAIGAVPSPQAAASILSARAASIDARRSPSTSSAAPILQRLLTSATATAAPPR